MLTNCLFIYYPVVCHRSQKDSAENPNQNNTSIQDTLVSENPIDSLFIYHPVVSHRSQSSEDPNQDNTSIQDTLMSENSQNTSDEENQKAARLMFRNQTSDEVHVDGHDDTSKVVAVIKEKHFVKFQADLDEILYIPAIGLFFSLLLSSLALLTGKV